MTENSDRCQNRNWTDFLFSAFSYSVVFPLAPCRKVWVSFMNEIQKVEEVRMRGDCTECQRWRSEGGTESEVLMGFYKTREMKVSSLKGEMKNFFLVYIINHLYFLSGILYALIHACGLQVGSWSTCTLITQEFTFTTISKVLLMILLLQFFLIFPLISSLLPGHNSLEQICWKSGINDNLLQQNSLLDSSYNKEESTRMW